MGFLEQFSCRKIKLKDFNNIRNQQNINEDYFRLEILVSRKIRRHELIKIHAGCGPRILRDWINIDLGYEPYQEYLQYYGDRFYPPNIRGSKDEFFALNICETGLPLPDDSVDVIFHEDFFEHLDQKEQIVFLAETLRVLKKGSVHRINTPDLCSSMKINSHFELGQKGVFISEWTQNKHKNLITKVSLSEIAIMVGYSKIEFKSRDKSNSILIPLEYRPDPRDRPEDGNIFADLIK